jgi:hypothetical protein
MRRSGVRSSSAPPFPSVNSRNLLSPVSRIETGESQKRLLISSESPSECRITLATRPTPRGGDSTRNRLQHKIALVTGADRGIGKAEAEAEAMVSSKAAARNHTKLVALHRAEQGLPVRCNSVHPAAILTPMWDPILGTAASPPRTTKEDQTPKSLVLLLDQSPQLIPTCPSIVFCSQDRTMRRWSFSCDSAWRNCSAMLS